jgi:hypothetical protein
VRAARAGTHRRPAQSRPRRLVPAPVSTHPGQPGRPPGNPQRPTFPDPPGLEILRSRTGSGRNSTLLIEARRSSRNRDTDLGFDPGDGPPIRTGGLGLAVGRDPVPRHHQRGRVVHEIEQVVEPAARISPARTPCTPLISGTRVRVASARGNADSSCGNPSVRRRTPTRCGLGTHRCRRRCLRRARSGPLGSA